MIHYYQVNLDTCESFAIKAKNIFQEIGNTPRLLETMNSHATIAQEKGEYGKFISLQDETYSLINQLDKSDTTYLNVLSNTLVAKRNTGNYSKAKTIGHEALLIEPHVKFKNIKDRIYTKTIILEQLSYLYSFTGDYDKAINYANLSLELKENNFDKNNTRLGDSYMSIAIAYSKMGDHNKAIPFYQKALDLFNKNKGGLEVAKEIKQANIRLATSYIHTNQILEAKKIVDVLKKKEDEIKKQLKGDFYFLSALYNLNLPEQNYALIEEYLQKSNDTYFSFPINSKSDFKISRNLNLLSSLYQKQGKYDQAEKLCLTALDSLGYSDFNNNDRQILNKATTIQILGNLFEVSKLKKDNELSNSVAKQINDLSQSLLFENSNAQNKLYWSERNLPLYNKLIQHFIDTKDLATAFNLIESNKSNLLINDLNTHLANGNARVGRDLVSKEKNIRSNLAYLQKKLNGVKEQNVINALKEDMLLQEIKLNGLLDSIELLHPNLYALKYKSEFSLGKLQYNMLDSDCLLEFFITTNKIFCIAITKNETQLIEIPFNEKVKSQIQAYYTSISDKNLSLVDAKKICKDSYKTLFASIDEYIKGKQIDKITIVADDFLNNIPFESLIDEEGNYLGLQYNFSYDYSAKLGSLLNKRNASKQDIDFLGYAFQSNSEKLSDIRSCLNPQEVKLICSSKEIQEISKIIKGKSIDTTSTKTLDLFDKASKAKILHLATHACADPDNPDLSRVYFNNEEITSLDIQLKEINSDLVVLSACESGYGKVFKGEGTMSLSKSFFHAGTKSTLVSLWPVDDCSTAELMKYFYQYLIEGQEKNLALKNAKKSYLENTHPNTSKPYYWAGFVLIGDTSPVWISRSFLIPALIGLASLLLLAFLFFRNKRA